MSKLESHIEQLEKQLLQLLAHVNDQKTALQSLRQENEALKKELQKQQRINMQPSKGLGQTEAVVQQFLQNKPDAKLLNQYMKTIDECIAFLENS